MQGWLGSKDSVVHSGEGPIHVARWSGNYIAWANDLGVKVSSSFTGISIAQACLAWLMCTLVVMLRALKLGPPCRLIC